MSENKVGTLAGVLAVLEQSGVTGTRRRDMVSAIKRICEMAGTLPASVTTQPSRLRELLSGIRPAAHGVTAKSYSNLRSLLGAALQLAGVIDPPRPGDRQTPPQMEALLEAIAGDQRLSNGLPPSQTGKTRSHLTKRATQSFSDSWLGWRPGHSTQNHATSCAASPSSGMRPAQNSIPGQPQS
jgi:hypothetical protein